MFERDEDIRHFALTSWANEIETGDRALSINDCIEQKKSNKIKMLTNEQRALATRIRALAEAETKYLKL